jgi:hypothetical protein
MQRYRANAGDADQSSSDYYRINVYYSFIDHVIRELETRFSSDHDALVAVQYLIPHCLSQLDQGKVDSLVSFYAKFLTYGEKENFGTELLKWKKSFEGIAVLERPKTASMALAVCSPQTFPTLHKIFTIFLTTPVGSVSCERSFFALRRLKLWTRSSMKEERLSGLAVMLVHRGTEYIPSPDDVYARKTIWRQYRS